MKFQGKLRCGVFGTSETYRGRLTPSGRFQQDTIESRHPVDRGLQCSLPRDWASLARPIELLASRRRFSLV